MEMIKMEKKSHFLKVYSEYCGNQVNSQELLAKIENEREEVHDFIVKASKDKRCRRLTLMSFLIAPLQRLCKYPLLIRVFLLSLLFPFYLPPSLLFPF